MNNTTGRIAFVQATWHRSIVDQAKIGFTEEIGTLGWPEDSIDFFEVPGAFEIPLHAKRLAQSGRYAGIVAAGLVVDGGIYRHDFVAQAVVDGLMRAGLDTGVPVLSVSLTPHHFQETPHHIGIFREHFDYPSCDLTACAQNENLRHVETPCKRTEKTTVLSAREPHDQSGMYRENHLSSSSGCWPKWL